MNVRRRICGLAVLLSLLAAVGGAQEKEGAKSPTRTVSSFDSRKDIVLNLKIEKKKS